MSANIRASDAEPTASTGDTSALCTGDSPKTACAHNSDGSVTAIPDNLAPIHESLVDLNAKVRQALMRLRRRRVRQNDGMVHFRVVPGTTRHDRTTRAIIGIPSRGCSHAACSWGGCSICGHVSSDLWRDDITEAGILADFRASLEAVKRASPSVLCIYTSGSLLDPKELPVGVRNAILAEVATCQSISLVALESLPQYMTSSALDELCCYLDHKQIRIGIGFDTSQEWQRNILYQRPIPNSAYTDALSQCVGRGIETMAYCVLGHPLLPPEVSRWDTAHSIRDALALGFDSVSIETVAVQPSTLQSALHRAGRYTIPTPWDVLSVLNAIPLEPIKFASRLFLGGQVFTPIPCHSMTWCPSCSAQIRSLVAPVPQEFWAEIPMASNASCCTGKTETAVSRGSPARVIDYALGQLASLDCEADCATTRTYRSTV